jgi:hypothetical protein
MLRYSFCFVFILHYRISTAEGVRLLEKTSVPIYLPNKNGKFVSNQKENTRRDEILEWMRRIHSMP